MNARTAKLIRRTAKAFMAALPDFKTVTFVNHPQSERGLIRRMKRRARVAQQRSFA